ncbi:MULTISPECIES: hypothetical protein [unclassified Nocardioides]|uniref:hypothetical protein n=1 Tax=unclassified Nocardioides TaxID=2615069 RepID=UPI003618C635
MHRTLVVVLTLLLIGVATVTWASWSAAATGTAGAHAAVVATPDRPDATIANGSVTVAWSTVTATGYVVQRTHQATGTTQPACGGAVVTTTQCVDSDADPGTWTYRVRARLGSWTGPWSTASTPVEVEGASTATLDVSPRSATPGDAIAVTGAGWPASSEVTVLVGGSVMCTVPSAADGTVASDASCPMPERAQGTYAVRASSGTTVVDAGNVAVVPGLRSVSPTTSPGGQLSVRGRGFAASSQVDVRLGERLLTRVTTTQSGETNTVQLTVPADVAPGSYALRLVDAAGNEAQAPVAVAAAGLQVTPASATPGDTVRVSGSGWPAGAAVGLRIRSTPMCSLTPDVSGAISGECTLPDTAGGDTEIVANNGTSTVATALRVLASVAPTSAVSTSPGGSLQLKVRGLGGHTAIGVQFDDGPVTPTGQSTPESGTLTFSVTVPQLGSGSHVVRVSDASGNAATTTITVVAPELTLSHSSGPTQMAIQVSGRNWPANVGVGIRFDGNTYNCTPVTRADGTFGPTSCLVPQLPGGPHAVTASSNTAVLGSSITFTITPKVTSTYSMASPGQSLILSATGLPASSSATFLIGGQQVATATTSSSGQANPSVPVPDLPAGPAAVQVVGALGASPEATLTIYRPTLQLSTSTIVPNQAVRVTGTGWPAGQFVGIRVGSSLVCTLTATGGNLDASCIPQAVPGGSGQVVTGTTNNVPTVTATAPGTVTVVAAAALDLVSAAPGQTVRATARGLLAGRTVELYVGGVLVESRSAAGDGIWTRAYAIPAGTPPGPLEFEFRQQDVPPARVTLTVTG